MEPFYIRFYNWLLVRIPVIPFPLGIFFWYVYHKSHIALDLGACQLSFGLFLLMPAWYLTFRPDLAIALLNALYAFIKPRSAYETVRPLFKRTSWKALTSSERIVLIVIASVALILGIWLIAQSYPNLSRMSFRYSS
jgi:hypothetical protein